MIGQSHNRRRAEEQDLADLSVIVLSVKRRTKEKDLLSHDLT
jgi:hypothetical protein